MIIACIIIWLSLGAAGEYFWQIELAKSINRQFRPFKPPNNKPDFSKIYLFAFLGLVGFITAIPLAFRYSKEYPHPDGYRGDDWKNKDKKDAQ